MIMAQSSFPLLCSANSLSSASAITARGGATVTASLLLQPPATSLAFTLESRKSLFSPSKLSSAFVQSRFVGLQAFHGLRVSPVCRTAASATEEIVETAPEERDFVDIGYISDVHGLQGEVRVKHKTDFADLRFGKPGKRWLRQRFSGKENILEVELVAGRDHPGDKSWIVKLSGFDSVDQARQLVGATFLVRESDRPELEEGEFYSRDLVGMRVLLKDTGEVVGTVVNVFSNGGNDLLHVMLYSSNKSPSEKRNSDLETSESGQFIWIPFVEAIVPDIDMDRGEMHITPPKGLLELNLRSGERSKKERRQLEWKERKKFQRRLIAAKKKLCELEQEHIFHGFRYGEKLQRNLLAEQIVFVNSNLLQLALKAVEMPNDQYNGRQSLQKKITKNCGSTLRISKNHLTGGVEEMLEAYFKQRETGLNLMSEGRVATVLTLNCGKHRNIGDEFKECENSTITLVETLFTDMQRFGEVKQRMSVPIILVLPAYEIQPLEDLFASREYFGFSPEKVRFLEEEKIPVVSSSTVEQKKNQVLMKSPWTILQSPLGSGGIINALSSCNILEELNESGVEYLELCNNNKRCLCGYPMIFGFMDSCKADIGVLRLEDNKEFEEEDFHIVLTMKSMVKLMKHIETQPLQTILKQNSHVELVRKEWVDVVPSSVNSYEFRCSIYDLLDKCAIDNACLMEVTE